MGSIPCNNEESCLLSINFSHDWGLSCILHAGIMKNNRLIILMTTVAVLLLIPLIAMQFTDEVNWNMADFMVAAVLLLVAVFTYEFISRKVKEPKNRTILSLVLLVIFLLIWAELAVGIFGTPFSGQ